MKNSPEGSELSSQSKPGYYRPVTAYVFPIEVSQQPAPPTHHFKQASTRGLIVFVDPEMVCELEYSLGQNCYLELWGPCVSFVGPVLLHNGLLFGLVQYLLLGLPQIYLDIPLYVEIVAWDAHQSQCIGRSR